MSVKTGGSRRPTESRASEDALRRSEERFRQVLEATPSALVMIDGEGVIEMVNGQTEAMFGYPRDELLGKQLEMLVPERFRDQHPGHRTSFHADPRARDGSGSRSIWSTQRRH
jgi:PAS domain S-box-containing protein